MQSLAVVTGRHPYQVAVHAAAVVCGVALAVTDQLPQSAAETMPRPVQVLWVVLLILAGVAAIAGAWWPGRVATALRVELAGVLLLAGGTTMYTITLYAVSGMQALAAGAFLAGVAGASWWRAGQLVRDSRRFAHVGERVGT